MSRDFTQSRDQRIIWHDGWVYLVISYHSAKFGGHQACRRGDILFLICHVTSCDHGVTGLCDIMGSSPHYKSPSCQVWWSKALCKRRNFVFCLSLDLTWLRGQRVMWRYGWVSLVISDYPAKFGDHIPFGRRDIKLSICHVTSCDHVVRGSCDIMGELSSS